MLSAGGTKEGEVRIREVRACSEENSTLYISKNKLRCVRSSCPVVPVPIVIVPHWLLVPLPSLMS